MEKIILKRSLSVMAIVAMIAAIVALPAWSDDSVNAATKKVKVIYKANGGKFTAKKYAKKKSYSKKIKKCKKLGKLPKISRTGYVLKGWYTKKTGGKKVTSNTRIKKKTALYAQWIKKYSLNDQYYKYMNQKKTIDKWEEIYGKLSYVKLFDDDIFIYKNALGIQVWFRINNINDMQYELVSIDSDVKTIVKNYTKKTKYKTFLKKMGVNKYEKLGSSKHIIYFKKSKMKWNVSRINKKYVQPNDSVSIWDPGLTE